MTRAQKEFYSLLLEANRVSRANNAPYIRKDQEKEAFTPLLDAFSNEFIAGVLEDNKAGTLYPEGFKGPDIEELLWRLYVRYGGSILDNSETEDRETWRVMRAAVSLLIDPQGLFVKVAQSKAMNALPALFGKALQIDLTGAATATVAGVDFIIDGYVNLPGLRTQTYMLNDAFLMEFARTHSPMITLPLSTYAEMRGLSTSESALKETRKEVVSDLKTLAAIMSRCKEKIGGKYIDSGIIRINGGSAYIKNGIIYWNYNNEIIPYLEKMAPLDYSIETLKADPRTNQYYFRRYIDLNYRMNEGRERVNTISIKTLLSKSPNIPTIESLKVKRASPKQKIILPFFRDLDSLEGIYYDVLDENGKIVNDPLNLGYEEFEKASLRIDYSDYQSNSDRLKNRKEREEAAKKTSRKGIKKSTV